MPQVSLGVSTSTFIDALALFGQKSQKGGKYSIIKTGSDAYHVAKKVNGLQYFLLFLVSCIVNLNAYTTKDMNTEEIKTSARAAINSDEQTDHNHTFQVQLQVQKLESRVSTLDKANQLAQIVLGLKELGFVDTDYTTSLATSAEQTFRERLDQHENNTVEIGLLESEDDSTYGSDDEELPLSLPSLDELTNKFNPYSDDLITYARNNPINFLPKDIHTTA